MIVGVGGVNAPLAVRGDVVHQPALRLGLRVLRLIQHGVVRSRLVGRQMFAPLQVVLVVQVEVLASGQRAPGDQLFDVQRERRVGAAVVDAGRPGGRGQHAAGLGHQVGEGIAHRARARGQVGQVATGLVLFLLERTIGKLAVRDGIEPQDGFRHLQRILQAGAEPAIDPAPLRLGQHPVFVGHRDHQPVHSHTLLFDRGPQRHHLLVELRVIALDHAELGHGLAGNRLALAAPPVQVAGLRDLVYGVVLQRDGNQVAHGFGQMRLRQLADLLRYGPEDVPVAARFPGRGHGRLHRVDEGVQVGGVQIGLLIPGGRGQDDVRIERRGVHAKVQIDHQVQFAGGRLLAVSHFVGVALGHLAGVDVAVRAQVVLHHVLVALHAGADGVAAPDEPDARPVGRRIGVLHREAQLAAP